MGRALHTNSAACPEFLSSLVTLVWVLAGPVRILEHLQAKAQTTQPEGNLSRGRKVWMVVG